MAQTTKLNEFKAPLWGSRVFLLAALELADYLERVKELIDGAWIKNLVPACTVVIHADAIELFDLRLKFFVGRQLHEKVPSLFNKVWLAFLAQQTKELVVVFLLLRNKELGMGLRII